jgi:hypothetical protein
VLTIKGLVSEYLKLRIQQIKVDLKALREDTINAYRWYLDK